jgi:hypothetical protein
MFHVFNEIEVLAESAQLPNTVTIPAYDRAKRGKKLSAHIPRIELVHNMSEADKICPALRHGPRADRRISSH